MIIWETKPCYKQYPKELSESRAFNKATAKLFKRKEDEVTRSHQELEDRQASINANVRELAAVNDKLDTADAIFQGEQ